MTAHVDVFFALVQGIATVLTDATRPDNPIVLANGAFSDLTGFTIVEIVGRNCRFMQAPDTDPATIRALSEAITARRQVAVEILNQKKARRQALLERPVSRTVVRCKRQAPPFIGNQIDITPRRNVEQAPHQLQKVEALGHLTAGVAHDFNNLLTIILTSVAALRRDNLTVARRSRYIEAIGSTADRASKLTGQLLGGVDAF